MSVSRFAIVTRYQRPDGRVVRHIYLNDDGDFFPTRSKATTARNRHLREGREYYGQRYDDELASGALEVNVVSVTDLSEG